MTLLAVQKMLTISWMAIIRVFSNPITKCAAFGKHLPFVITILSIYFRHKLLKHFELNCYQSNFSNCYCYQLPKVEKMKHQACLSTSLKLVG